MSNRFSFSILCAVVFCAYFTAPQEASAQSPAPAEQHGSVIVDQTGKPLEGVGIYLQQRPRFPIPQEVVETSPTLSNAGGKFSVPDDIPPGSLIVFSKEGYSTRAFPADKALPEEIRLSPGEKISGVVVNEKGTSIPNALIGPAVSQVGASLDTQKRLPFLFTRGAADGAFAINGLARGRYDVLFQAPDYSPKVVTMIPGAPKKVALESGGTTVTGMVRGSRDQLAQPNVVVQASGPSMRLYATTDAGGQYTFFNLGNAEWTFRVVNDLTDQTNPSRTVEVAPASEPLPIDLVMNQGMTVAGDFLNAETSAPLAGIWLRLDTDPPRTGETDASGHFKFEKVEAFADAVLRFDSTKFYYETPEGLYREYVELPKTGGEDITSLTIVLRPRAVISGKVTDNFNQPVQNAVVTARIAMPEGESVKSSGSMREYTAKTDIDGDYRCSVFPTGRYEVFAEKERLISLGKQTDTFTTAPGIANLVVMPSVDVVGVVRDPSDRPLADAQIEMTPEGQTVSAAAVQHPDDKSVRKTTSDAKGEFRIEKVWPGRVNIIGRHRDYFQVTTETVTLDPNLSQTIVLRFTGGRDFSAIVTSVDGKPIGDAEVNLYYTVAGEQKFIMRQTEANGRVEARAVPVDKLDRLTIRTEKHVGFEQANVPLPQEDMAVVLKERGVINVTVDVPGGGTAPAGQTTVLLLGAGADPSGTPPSADNYSARDERPLTANKAVFQNLDPGWYKAGARRGSLYAESDAIEVKEGTSVNLAIVLEAAGAVRGRVSDKESGRPIADVTITLKPQAQGLAESEPPVASSGSDGSFQIAGISAGAMVLTAVHAGYPEHFESVQVPARGGVDVQIRMSAKTSKLSGNVLYAGSGVPNALLVLYKSATNETPLGTAVSDASGRYEITNVPPGKYVLTVEAPVGTSDDTLHKGFDVTVTDQPAMMDATFERLTHVTGKVSLSGGKIGEGSALLFIAQEGGSTKTVPIAADGTYEADMEPGTYTVGFEDRPGTNHRIPSSEQPFKLDLKF